MRFLPRFRRGTSKKVREKKQAKPPKPVPTSRMGKAWHYTKKTTKRAVAAVVLFHALTNLGYFTNYAYHKMNPSKLRQEFARVHGIELQGWRADIEFNPKLVTSIGMAVQSEKMSGPFSMGSITLESENYLKKNILDQLEKVATSGHSAYATPGRVSSNSDNGAGWRTTAAIHHEIKHIKTFELLKRNPEFKLEWKKVSTDANGNDLYLSVSDEIKSRVKGLGGFIDPKKLDPKKCEELGFITPYARTNFYEDVAELGEAAEELTTYEGSNPFYDWIFGEKKNLRIIAKVSLAQKYRIVPKEFTVFVHLFGNYRKAFHNAPEGGIGDEKAGREYLEESEQFMVRFPDSKYCPQIHSVRAYFIQALEYGNQSNKRAIHEYLEVLKRPPLSSAYPAAIEKLAELYREANQPGLASRVDEAYKEYYRRFDSGDQRLAVIGVKDVLEKAGILK